MSPNQAWYSSSSVSRNDDGWNFEEAMQRAMPHFEEERRVSLQPLPPPPSRISRERTPDWQYEVNHMSPDCDLLEDSQSVFDSIGRTPSPDTREHTPPSRFQSVYERVGLPPPAPWDPAGARAKPAQSAAYHRNATLSQSVAWQATPTDPEGFHPNVSRDMGSTQRASGQSDHTSRQRPVQYQSRAQLRPAQTTARIVSQSSISEATDSTSERGRHAKPVPTGPLRRSERIAQNPSKSGRYATSSYKQ